MRSRWGNPKRRPCPAIKGAFGISSKKTTTSCPFSPGILDSFPHDAQPLLLALSGLNRVLLTIHLHNPSTHKICRLNSSGNLNKRFREHTPASLRRIINIAPWLYPRRRLPQAARIDGVLHREVALLVTRTWRLRWIPSIFRTPLQSGRTNIHHLPQSHHHPPLMAGLPMTFIQTRISNRRYRRLQVQCTTYTLLRRFRPLRLRSRRLRSRIRCSPRKISTNPADIPRRINLCISMIGTKWSICKPPTTMRNSPPITRQN